MATSDRHSYVEFYPSDWLAGVGFMPPLAEWVYLQVCIYNWDKAEPMPAADIPLRLARHADWQADLTILINAGKIIKTQGGGLFVSRALAQARKAFDLWAKKSKGGKGRHSQKDAQESSSTPDKGAASNENENENENDRGSREPHAGAHAPAPPDALARTREGDGSNGDLIFSVPNEVWADFRQHRDKIKAPMTPRAEALILKKLEELHNAGHDPTAVIEQTMRRGWRDVFELKESNDGRFGNNGGGDAKSRNGLANAGLEAVAQDRGERPNR